MKVITSNCHGIMTCLVDLYNLCDSCDIVFLQETWLFSEKLCILSQVHLDFKGYGLSVMNTCCNGLFRDSPFD